MELKVALITRKHQHAATYEGGTYRLVLPLEVCRHDHRDLREAIECGAPRAVTLAAVMRKISRSMMDKLEGRR